MIDELNSNSDDKNLLQNWMTKNRVSCNSEKEKFVVFEKRYVKYSNIKIGDNEISSLMSYKYFGLFFDKKLNFEVHITNVIQKLARHSGILYNLGETLNKRKLIQYIRSYVSPVVQYCALLCGLGPKSRPQKTLLLQKKLIRIILRLPP